MQFNRISRFFSKDTLIFVLVFFVLIIVYDYQKTSFLGPQGLHQWRQSVGAAYAMNYYIYDLDVTESRIFNYISEGGDSDKTIAEFPIIYYLIAIFYKIFGNHDAVFRIVNALILFLGLFCLFKATKIILGDTFWAMFLSVVLFTSPTLIYYGNSYLPDTSALGLALIALYFIVKYWQLKHVKYLYLAALFYALAGLFKVTSLISYIAISGTFVLFYLFSKDFRGKYNILQVIVPALIPAIAVFAWYYYVQYYGSTHGVISPVELRPIWILDSETISYTWNRITREWVHSYLSVYLQLIALASFLISIVLFRKSNKFLSVFTFLVFIGGFIFSLMFYRSLYHHDYYLINVFIVIVFILLGGLIMLKQYYPGIFKSVYLKGATVLLVVFTVYSAIDIVHNKFFGTYNKFHNMWYYGFTDIEKVNRTLGIEQDDKVIVLPEDSINISLYLMRQPGWTAYGFNDKKETERMNFFISKGAKYLYVCDRTIYDKETFDYLKPYLTKKIGENGNVDIYDLRGL